MRLIEEASPDGVWDKSHILNLSVCTTVSYGSGAAALRRYLTDDPFR